MCVNCVAITLSKWDLLEQKRKQEEEAARKQASYEDIDGRLAISHSLFTTNVIITIIIDALL